MDLQRSAGILLHITSLPGSYGIGTLGQEAIDFADCLKKAGQSYWQILPIGPVLSIADYCPYASPSTFAGNPLMISLEKLAEEEWFSEDAGPAWSPENDFVDFKQVERHKIPLLKSAEKSFFDRASKKQIETFENFCTSSSFWLEDYALFAACAEHFNTNNWRDWDRDIVRRRPKGLKEIKQTLAESIRFQKFLQYIFFSQWQDFKDHCNRKGIHLIGDIPVYVTLDSADAWSHPDIFQLDRESGRPKAVAGVPPDYFSKTGQRWGNPLYRWKTPDGKLNRDTVSWWVKRIGHLRHFMDIIRIDHFRGFESYWSIPARHKTAVKGKWVKGPGRQFFTSLQKRLGDLPLIAEDLGDINQAVLDLRDDLDLPGMKVLQFAFDGDPHNTHLPHMYTNPNCLVYTGTHDNNTSNGWFYGTEIDDSIRKYVMEYTGTENFSDMHWNLIRLAYRSVAMLAIIPVQDMLGFGESFRMNTPGTSEKNWRWKLKKEHITEQTTTRLHALCRLYGRCRE